MITGEKQLSPWFEVIDESFNDSHKYDLYITCGKGIFSWLLLDTDRNKFIALKDYSFSSQKELSDVIEKIYDENTSYFEAASKTVVNFAGGNFTIVPSAFYSEAEKDVFFRLNNELKPAEITLTDTLRLPDAKLIYSVDLTLTEYMQEHFSATEFHHAANSFLEGIYAQHKNYDEKIISVNVYHSFFEIAVTSGRSLLMLNRFNYHSPEDFMYYILFACEQLRLNPETVPFYFSGMIEKNSALYLLAQKYLRHLSLARRPDFCDYSYKFEESEGHLHFAAFNTYLCA